MALSYPRRFNAGRGSELLYNEELHKSFEATRHLLDRPDELSVPKTQLDGALWLQRRDGNNELKTWVKSENRFVDVFANKFQIIDQMTSAVMPAKPVHGQFWIHNDVLCYYDGHQWKPVKALSQDSAQFDTSIFNDYIFASPLWRQGNTVVTDNDVESFTKIRREYLQGKIDLAADSAVYGTGKKWCIGDTVDIDEPEIDAAPEGLHQFVVPNIDIERVFLNGTLDHNYTKVNQFTITYEKKDLIDRTPTLIHVNPNKLVGIEKRLFKVDRSRPRIDVSNQRTEYYGFKLGSKQGQLLIPEAEQDDGGYIIDGDSGIILSRDQAQHYDYILTVTFAFESDNFSGYMKYVNDRQGTSSYYIPEFAGGNNVFVEGLALEGTEYHEDSKSKTISIKGSAEHLEVQIMHSGLREYGYVREMTHDNKAVINVLHDFVQPLVFLGGEALSPEDYTYDSAKNAFTIEHGRYNMPWVVLELCDKKHEITDTDGDFLTVGTNKKAGYKKTRGINGAERKIGPYLITGKDTHGDPVFDESGIVAIQYYDMLESVGTVAEEDDKKQGLIHYTNDDYTVENRLDSEGLVVGAFPNHAVLFVDGLMIKQDDLIIDRKNKTISAPGLRKGQRYILLKDKYNYFVNTSRLLPALEVDRLSDSLVYFNGKLLCNASAITKNEVPGKAAGWAKHNELVHFLDDTGTNPIDIRCYDAASSTWKILTMVERRAIYNMLDGYENMLRTIAFSFEWNKETDRIDVYAFHFANDAGRGLVIGNLPSEYDDPNSAIDEHNQPLAGVMSGDAPEIAANRIHFFEKDIRDAINDLPESFTGQFSTDPAHIEETIQKTREEAIRKLNTTPKYSSLHYHQFTIPEEYVPETGSLCVYVNGVRQYEVKELSENTFALPWPVRGLVTYTIESSKEAGDTVAKREVLGAVNAVPDLINTYHTTINLFPGKLVVYVDGVRQSQDSYHVLDAHTIMFKSSDTRLIGNSYNYPDETIMGAIQRPVSLHHRLDDRILVEVFQDHRWQEKHLFVKQKSENYILGAGEYDFDVSLLRSKDELKIYIDGLFFGLKDHDGYVCNKGDETLTITRPEIINRLIGDPLYEFLLKDKAAMRRWVQAENERRINRLMQSTYNMTREAAIAHLKNQGLYDQDRLPEQKDMIIEWR